MTTTTKDYAATSAEKAQARRREKAGKIRIERQAESRVLRVAGKNRLVIREVYWIEEVK